MKRDIAGLGTSSKYRRYLTPILTLMGELQLHGMKAVNAAFLMKGSATSWPAAPPGRDVAFGNYWIDCQLVAKPPWRFAMQRHQWARLCTLEGVLCLNLPQIGSTTTEFIFLGTWWFGGKAPVACPH